MNQYKSMKILVKASGTSFYLLSPHVYKHAVDRDSKKRKTDQN